jgi:hypothetical protein
VDRSLAAVETHISQVFFTEDRAYKLLKPVTTGFVDFADRERRLEAANQELRLNRRLAPDVYLGLANVWEDGDLVDHMIIMRRLPSNRRLATLLADAGSGSPAGARSDPAGDSGSGPPMAVTECLAQVARAVASLHLGAPALTGDAAEMATRDAVARNWHDNFAAIADFVGPVVDRAEFEEVASLAGDYLDAGAELFQHRIDRGWVRDGHGDLRAEDIFCLDDGPRILDCLAFSRDLRVADVLNDIAFLAMDLHHLAGAQLADDFVALYQSFTGEVHPASLAHHYVAYRAHVRVKVACLQLEGGDSTKAAEAAALHGLALRQLRLGQLAVDRRPPGEGYVHLW